MAKEGIGTSSCNVCTEHFFCSLFLLFDVLIFIPFVDCKNTIVKQFRVAHKNMHLLVVKYPVSAKKSSGLQKRC